MMEGPQPMSNNGFEQVEQPSEETRNLSKTALMFIFTFYHNCKSQTLFKTNEGPTTSPPIVFN